MKMTFLTLIVFLASLSLQVQAGSAFSEQELCIAGIATNNGRSPKGIRVLATQGKEITVAYTRNDGKIFGYTCKVEGNEIRWRDQSMSNWNKNIRIYYSTENGGKTLIIKSVVYGEALSKSFTKSDF